MRLKKQANFSEQLQAERDIIEGSNVKEALSFIETFVIRQVCPLISLRLLSLLSVTQDGLSSKQYRSLSKLYAQSFGHEHVITFLNLKKLKLFYEHPSPSPTALLDSTPLSINPRKSHRFRDTVKKLGLIPTRSSYDLKNPEDASFVFGGAFVPVICCLLDSLLMTTETAGNSTTAALNDTSKCLSGGGIRVSKRSAGSNRNLGSWSNARVIAVYFLGGVTFAEISAIRFWSLKKGVKVVVLTTSILNGNSLMRSLMTIK